MIFQLLSYIGIFLAFIFATLAIAAALYYISELVEEYSVLTKKVLTQSIYLISGIFILLWLIDSFPFKLCLFSLFTYLIYYQNLKSFPFISLTSPIFIGSCLLVLINHYIWFKYFNSIAIPTWEQRLDPNFKHNGPPSFSQVASFFGLCVWFIPFALFVSLSAGENVLPTANDLNQGPLTPRDAKEFENDYSNLYGGDDEGSSSIKRVRKRGAGLAKVVVQSARDTLAVALRSIGWKSESRRDGLII